MRVRHMWVAALAVAVLAGGVGVAFAASSRSSAPHHNSRGCVPTNDDTHSLAPDSCGPGNYPLSAFYKNAHGQIALSCADHAAQPGETTTTEPAEGEPDPHCRPMSQADMERSDRNAREASKNQATTPLLVVPDTSTTTVPAP